MNKLGKQMGLSVSPKWGSQTITAFMTRLWMSSNTFPSSSSSSCSFSLLVLRLFSVVLGLVSSDSQHSLLNVCRPNDHPSFFSLLISHSSFQIIASLDEDPAAQSKQLTLRLQQIAAALENKVTDL